MVPPYAKKCLAVAALVTATATPLFSSGSFGAAEAWGATAPRAAVLSPKDQQDVQRIDQYLNGLTTFQAKFTQQSSDGGSAQGTMYLSRPGKMRFQYSSQPLLLVSNGDLVAYDDLQLKQVSYENVSSTPAWFLLRKNVQLNGDVTLTNFQASAGVIRASFVQTGSPDDGLVTLVFSDQPLELRQWTIVDAQDKSTTVTLEDAHAGGALDSDLFHLPSGSQPQTGSGHN